MNYMILSIIIKSIWFNWINNNKNNKNGIQPTISILVHASREFNIYANLFIWISTIHVVTLIVMFRTFLFPPVRTNIECRSAKNPFLLINYIIQLDLHSFISKALNFIHFFNENAVSIFIVLNTTNNYKVIKCIYTLIEY